MRNIGRKVNGSPAPRRPADLCAVLHALADPVRLEIVLQLTQEKEVACGAFGIDMPKSSLSHHFRVLREAGIIGTRQEGTSKVNFMTPGLLADSFPGLLQSVLRAVKEGSRTPEPD